MLEPARKPPCRIIPGRLGYWHVGVPPSGPMDALAFRLANRMVGNRSRAAALEIAVTGPTLRFRHGYRDRYLRAPTWSAQLDGVPVARCGTACPRAGGLGPRDGPLCKERERAPISRCGAAFDVPEYLGSRSTFILGKFGGHAGRVFAPATCSTSAIRSIGDSATRAGIAPCITNEWEIGVLYGPHGAPDFFTDEDIDDVLFGRRGRSTTTPTAPASG